MNKFFQRFKCFIGKHKRIYWSKEKCQKENVMWGAFAPWDCPHCGYTCQIFPLSLPPENRSKSC